MGETSIEWTANDDGTPGKTWNPIRGCSRTIAEGATQSGCGDGTGGGCYAERTAGRFCGSGKPFEGFVRLTAKGARWTGQVELLTEHLADPLRWRKPTRVFVNSMSDLFHERLSNEAIAAVFGVMAAAPQHTFIVLTKRARRMREWFEWAGSAALDRCAVAADDALEGRMTGARLARAFAPGRGARQWPLRSVWVGVSVENQAAADERIPELLRTPAAVRLLSCEPLLGGVDLASWIGRIDHCGSCGAENAPQDPDRCPACGDEDCLISTWGDEQHEIYRIGKRHTEPFRDGPEIHWIIAGIESGPGARGCDVSALLSLLDQCEEAGVPFFAKQWRAVPECIPAPPGSDPSVTGAGGWVDLVAAGKGSHRKPGGIIGAPYVRGKQRLAFPEVRRG